MISDESESNDDNIDDGPSKSQLKRDAHAVRDLGTELSLLGAAERARVPLPEDIVDAIDELNRTTKNGARKRQLGWLAKRLRKIDIEPIDAALESIRRAARANTQTLHLVEQWRDRLLGNEDQPDPKTALTDFLDKYPHADRQLLRQLQRSAMKEHAENKPTKSARVLFKAVRDAVNHVSENRE